MFEWHFGAWNSDASRTNSSLKNYEKSVVIASRYLSVDDDGLLVVVPVRSPRKTIDCWSSLMKTTLVHDLTHSISRRPLEKKNQVALYSH